MEVRGKGAFVTGGARGIGRAITEALLDKGAKVVFCDVIKEVGEAAEKELQSKYGAGNVIFTPCDVTDYAQLSASFQKAVSLSGCVQILVNNAGITREDDIELCVAVNQIATMRGTLLAEEHMRKDKGGRGGIIINVSSVAGLYAGLKIPVYAATKHAVLGFTTSVALRQSEETTGVRLCCMLPWFVSTEMTKDVESMGFFGIPREAFMDPSVIGMVVVEMVEEGGNNGGLMEVWSRERYGYRRRQVVDKDGVSHPCWSDEDPTDYIRSYLTPQK